MNSTAAQTIYSNTIYGWFARIVIMMLLILAAVLTISTIYDTEVTPQQELATEIEAPSTSELVSNYFEFKEQMDSGENIPPLEMDNLEFLVDSFRSTILDTIVIYQLGLNEKVVTEEGRAAITEFLTSLKSSE